MTTTVLAYFPSPPRGVWYLGPVPIRAYALFIIAGIVVALVIGDRRWEARGGERGIVYDIALWAVPFGLVGGRLYHLATDWRTYFGEGGAGLGAALRVWDGGLGIWGAIALGAVGAWIGCRRRGIPLPAFTDATAPGIILAQAIGRLGNYFNQELFGRETTMPWGLEIFYRRDPAGFVDVHSLDGVSTGQLAMVVQPTFLYELLWNVLIFVMLIYLDRRFRIGHGRLFALYVAGYCVGRFYIELLRDDVATHIAGVRINSFTSTFLFIGAVVYLILAPKGREDPTTLRGAPAEEPEAEPEPTAEAVTVAAPTATAEAEQPTESMEAATEGVPAVDAETEAIATAAEEAEAPEAEESVAPEPAGEEALAEQPEVEETEALAAAAEEPEAEAIAAEAEEAEAAEAEEPEVAEPEPEEAEAEEPEPEEPVAQMTEPTTPSPGRWRSRLSRLRRRQPEVEEPEAQEAAAEEPEAEAIAAEAEEAEVAEPEEPEVAEPEPEEAEAEEAEGAEPAEPAAEEAEAEAITAEGEQPEAAEVEKPEEAEAEPEAEEPEAEEPEAEEPEAEEPEAEEPEAEEPEPEEPVAQTTEPTTPSPGRWRSRLSRLRRRPAR